MISSKTFNDSCVLLKCFELALKEKDDGKFMRGKLLCVFPLYISCIGKNLPEYVMPKVAVIDSLKALPVIGICFDHFLARVLFETSAYFCGVLSKFIISDSGMSSSSTILTIWC